jgi:adenylate kinase family enzyme
MFKIEMEEKETPIQSTLWAEKYRPNQLDDFVGNSVIMESIKLWIEKKDIPQVFLFGSPGCGKTSLAKILIKHIPCDVLFLNASDENSVDIMRNKVQDFAMTMGMEPLKIIILDECLDENTIIWVLRDGKEQGIPIKDVNSNDDLVKSLNIDQNRIEWRPFYLINQGEKEVYEIEFNNGEVVICTDTHKWYVKDDNDKIIRVKTIDLIRGKYNSILTTEENRMISESQ